MLNLFLHEFNRVAVSELVIIASLQIIRPFLGFWARHQEGASVEAFVELSAVSFVAEMSGLRWFVVRWTTRVHLPVLEVEFSGLVIGFFRSGRLIWCGDNFRDGDVWLWNWHPAGKLDVCRILWSDTVGQLWWRLHGELSRTLRQHSWKLWLSRELWHWSHHRPELAHELRVLHHELWETFHHVWWKNWSFAFFRLWVEKLLGSTFHVKRGAVFAFPIFVEVSLDGKVVVLKAGRNLRDVSAGLHEAGGSCRLAISSADVPWIIAHLFFFIEVEAEWALMFVGFVA